MSPHNTASDCWSKVINFVLNYASVQLVFRALAVVVPNYHQLKRGAVAWP